jgi:hypothetical protein
MPWWGWSDFWVIGILIKLARDSSQSMAQQLLFLEFNEINLESLRYYADRRLLPKLHRLIENNGWATTTSEQRYEDVEPWIGVDGCVVDGPRRVCDPA